MYPLYSPSFPVVGKASGAVKVWLWTKPEEKKKKGRLRNKTNKVPKSFIFTAQGTAENSAETVVKTMHSGALYLIDFVTMRNLDCCYDALL